MRLQEQKSGSKKRPKIEDFNALYETGSDAIFRFCYTRVGDRELALDMVGDVFTAYWQTLSNGTTIEHPRAFIYRSARNRIIDWYRKKKTVSLESLTNPETEEPYEPINETILEDMKMASEGRFLIEKITDISHGNRDAVYLRFVEGLSPPEIAEILGISANATSVRINRGIAELRKITGYNIEEEK